MFPNNCKWNWFGALGSDDTPWSLVTSKLHVEQWFCLLYVGMLLATSTIQLCYFLLFQKRWQNGDPVSFQKSPNRNKFVQTRLYFAMVNGRPKTEICSVDKTRKRYKLHALQKSHFVSPKIINVSVCSALILTNLAQPQWITTHCDKKLAITFYCKLSSFGDKRNASNNIPMMVVCGKTCVLRGDTFYNFQWSSAQSDKVKKHSIYSFGDKTTLEFVFHAISHSLAAIIFPNLTLLSYTRCSLTYKYTVKPIFNGQKENLLLVSTQSGTELVTHGGLFMCQSGTFLSIRGLCDGKIDCSFDHSDEDNCTCQESSVYSRLCKHIVLNLSVVSCSEFYSVNHSGGCQPYSFASTNSEGTHQSTEESNSRSYKNHVLKLMPQNIMDMPPHLHCYNQEKLLCGNNERQCFDIGDICVYKLNDTGNLKPCTRGGHMQECKHFECNTHYKCPNYHCIPWAYVCDGKWDCPHGQEETGNQESLYTRPCQHLFQCWESNICVHISDICGGHIDCQNEDDEIFCPLKTLFCPSFCDCLVFAVWCYNVTTSQSVFWIFSCSFMVFQSYSCAKSEKESCFAAYMTFLLNQFVFSSERYEADTFSWCKR